MKMSWFKHYNTAHDGQTFSELWAENDTDTIAFYWTVLEMVSRWEDPIERGKWTANLSIFRSKLGMKSQRSGKLLINISKRFDLNLSLKPDGSFELLIPKWLELQENRGGKRLSKKDQKAPRSKKEEVRGKKEDSAQEQSAEQPQPAIAGLLASEPFLKEHKIISIWNEHCGKLPKAKVISKARQHAARLRWKENPDPEFWITALKNILADPFCTGDLPGKNWHADIDWFLRPNSAAKYFEKKPMMRSDAGITWVGGKSE